MAGPACEVLLETDDNATLLTIDEVLSSVADEIERTRNGRTWDIRVHGRPIHICVEKDLVIGLSAGCNGREDYEILRQLSTKIAAAVGGLATEPTK